jgi:hypothetical protein
MLARMTASIGGLLLWTAGAVHAQLEFRAAPIPSSAANPPQQLHFTANEAAVTLGKPIIRSQTVPASVPAVDTPSRELKQKNEYFFHWARPIIRAQSGEIPPLTVPTPGNPPPFPGAGPAPPPFPGSGSPGTVTPPSSRARKSRAADEDYLCAKINDDADLGSFWSRSGQKVRHCWEDLRDGFTGAFSGRNMFESDHRHDELMSPISNPYYFEDPRALTELRPVFIWQDTRSSNKVFAGSSNYFIDLQARVAFTETFSVVINRLGWTWANPGVPNAFIPGDNGFSELHLGPKFSFELFECSMAAVGANFELGIGNRNVAQDTGNLSISPYFSYGCNFGDSFMPTGWGMFNFLNTTGYSIPVDSQRSDFLYSSFHLDFDVAGMKKFYPLVELNWTYYPFNGGARPFNFEGHGLFNFGSTGVAGNHDLTLAAGARYRFSNNIMMGAAGEFGLLGGDRHLDGFRLLVDFIFRY